MSYDIFSSVYDILTDNVDYQQITDRICSLLSQNGINGGLLLDLGCGTGTLSFMLEEKGYEIIGVDPSEDMLSVANEKKYELDSPAIFLCQSGENLDLYGTIDCAVSSLDTINHIDSLDKVQETFKRISLFMNMGGIFVFDMNTPYKHKKILGNNVFFYDMDEVYCIWHNSYDDKNFKTDIELDFFIKNEDDDNYQRYNEAFSEYSYDIFTIIEMLNDCGFELLGCYDEYTDNEVTYDSQRVTFVAKKTKTIFKDELK